MESDSGSRTTDGGTGEQPEAHKLEQNRTDSIPNYQTAGEQNRDVLPERQISDGLPLVFDEQANTFIGWFDRPKQKLAEGEAAIVDRLTPFSVMTKRWGKVELRRNSRFYFEDHDVHVQVSTVDIDAEGRLFVTLREMDQAYPRRSWIFRTIDLARYIEAERLRSMTEVNERIEGVMESLRSTDTDPAQEGTDD